MNKYLYITYCILSFAIVFVGGTLSSCERNYEEIECHQLSLNGIKKDTIIVSNFISEVEIIPLEDNIKCIINDPLKLLVVKDGFLINNYISRLNQILFFDMKGHFKNKIGSIGHGKGEYVNVIDFATDRDGDTIVVADINAMFFYNKEGKPLFKRDVSNDYFVKQIGKTKNRYIYASEYCGSDYQIHVFDHHFNLIKELIPTNGASLMALNYYRNNISIEGEKACYCDYFSSTLHLIDLSSENESLTSYHIADDDMLSLDIAMNPDPEVCESKGSRIHGFRLEDEYIVGDVVTEEWERKTFKIDTKNNSVSLVEYNEWFPNISDYYDGAYYALLDQTELLDIIEDREYQGTYLSRKIKDNYKKKNLNVNEKSNYVILILKKKNVQQN